MTTATTTPTIADLVAGAGRPRDVKVPDLRTERFTPQKPPTQGQVLAKRQAAPEGPGIAQVGMDAIKSEWMGSWAMRQFDQMGYDADPDFPGVFADDERFQKYTEGLDPSMWEGLVDATSDKQAMVIRSQLLGVQESRHRLEQAGWGGTAARIAASILDPVTVAAGAATGGLTWAARGTRLARMIKTGAVSALTEGASEAYLTTRDPERDIGGVLLTATGAFALGGGIAGLMPNRVARALDRLEADTEAKDWITFTMGAASSSEFNSPEVRAMMKTELLRDGARMKFKETTAPDARRAIVDTLIDEGSGLDPVADAELIANLKAQDPDDLLRRFVVEDDIGETAGKVSESDTRGLGADEDAILGVESAKTTTPPADDPLGGLDDLAAEEVAATSGRTSPFANPIDDGPSVVGIDTAPAAKADPAPGKARKSAFANPDDDGLSIEGIGGTGGDQIDLPGDITGDGSAKGPPPKTAFDFQPANVSDAKADLANIRIDIAGMLGNSEGSLSRFVMRYSAQDSLLARNAKGDFVAATDSATEWIRREYRRRIGNVATAYAGLTKRFNVANGYTGLKSFEGKKIFSDAVARAIRSDASYKAATDAVKEGADLFRKEIADVLKMAQAHGVKDAIEIGEDANYLNRIWSRSAIAAAINVHGREAVESLIAGAVKKAMPKLRKDIAERIGKGMLRRIERYGDHLDIDNAKLHSLTRASLEDLLTREVEGITSGEVQAIVSEAIPQTGVTTSLHKRTILDEGHNIRTRSGALSIQDLLENDAPKLLSIYTRQMLGASAEAEIARGVSAKLGRTVQNFMEINDLIQRELQGLKVDARTIKREMETHAILQRSIRGSKLPSAVDQDSNAGQVLRFIRGLNYLRLSGGFGIAQLPELGGLVAEAGMSVMVRQMPVLGEIFSRAKTGTMNNQLLSEIEAIWGWGLDHHIEQFAGHLDDFGTEFQVALNKYERGVQQANMIQTRLSGLAAVDNFSRRAAAVAAIQRIADIAAGRKISTKRLLDLGLTETQAAAIAKQINANVETFPGMFGKKVKRINFDKWDDLQAKADFIVAVNKWAGRVIQTNDIGSMNRFMTGELGKTLMQFRTFAVQAYTKNTLHKLQMHDSTAAINAVSAWIMGSLVFAAQTYVQSIGRKDAEQFRKERLDASTIARIGWARSGWSSMLPGVIDNGLSVASYDPWFKFGRYSGLETTGLLQNPTTQFATAAQRSLRAGAKQLRDVMGGKESPFTQADRRAVEQLIPYQNLIGVKNLLDSFVSHGTDK